MAKVYLDWSLLPSEILQMISEKLISIYDFIHFRAVCNTWRSASCPHPQHLPPQLPWLILPSSPDEDKPNHSSTLSVYDLSQSRTHILDLPEIQGKHICGSSNGWLVLEKEEVWLFNPVTRDQISLPSLNAKPNSFLGTLSGGNSKDDFLDRSCEFCIKKAILSSNPSIDPDCFVMALFLGNWELAFCRIGDECWTTISDSENSVLEHYVVNIGYHNGLLYVFKSNGHVRICNFRAPFCKLINPERKFEYIHPVEGGSNEHGLMILRWNYPSRFNNNFTSIHSILTWCDKQENWLDVEEEHLNSTVFFMGFEHQQCISLPISNLKLEEWEGNYTCYISPQDETIDNVLWYSCSIKLYGPNNRIERTLASHVRLFRAHRYCFSRPSFIWLTPSLC